MNRALLGNRYRLGERIADGDMGSVYRGGDDNLGRPVAVAWEMVVVIALLLLAWLPRSGRSDPPAGHSGHPRTASPTTAGTGDEDD